MLEPKKCFINPYCAGGLYGQYKMMKKPKIKCLKPWHMGTPLRVLSKSYPMNTNMVEFRWFSKYLCPCALDESSLSIGGVNIDVHSFSFPRTRRVVS